MLRVSTTCWCLRSLVRRDGSVILEIQLPVLQRSGTLHGHAFAARWVGDALRAGQHLKDSCGLSVVPGHRMPGAPGHGPNRTGWPSDLACAARVRGDDRGCPGSARWLLDWFGVVGVCGGRSDSTTPLHGQQRLPPGASSISSPIPANGQVDRRILDGASRGGRGAPCAGGHGQHLRQLLP